MFLPSRSIVDEKAEKQRWYNQVEKLCTSLIISNEVKETCIISVQEVICGDPDCAPIDTMISLSFPSGGQGMFALPMEPKEVTIDILRENFPPEDILEKWMNGEDVEWPPFNDDDGAGDAPMELRFNVGTAVVCRIGPDTWEPGTVSKLWYRENGWPEGAYAPYQVTLDDGRKIFAPFDNDQVVRAKNANITSVSIEPTSKDSNNSNMGTDSS